jgi:hypothetical protein
MGKLLPKIASWIALAIASKTSGDIARFLVVVLSVMYALGFVWDRIL